MKVSTVKSLPVCPFCGSSELTLIDLGLGDLWCVACVCGSQGPTGETADEACNLWSKRLMSKQVTNKEAPIAEG